MNNAVEEECRGSSWSPSQSWRLIQDDKQITLTDNNSSNFLGRLARELIHILNPR